MKRVATYVVIGLAVLSIAIHLGYRLYVRHQHGETRRRPEIVPSRGPTIQELMPAARPPAKPHVTGGDRHAYPVVEELKELADTEVMRAGPKAEPSKLREYTLVLAPQFAGLPPRVLKGEEIVAVVFAPIDERIRNKAIAEQNAQRACISATARQLDKLLLESFYVSAEIPVPTERMFSSSVVCAQNGETIVRVTYDDPVDTVPSTEMRFITPSSIYDARGPSLMKEFRRQAVANVRRRRAKEFLKDKVSGDDIKLLSAERAFRDADLLAILRPRYEATLYVPGLRADLQVPVLLSLLLKSGLVVRPSSSVTGG